MTAEELKKRTKKFTVDTIFFLRTLPKNNDETWVISKQLLRSSSSVGSNYRAACRSRSDQEFAAKLGVVIEEADESAFWLEIIQEIGIGGGTECQKLEKEASEIVAITNAARQTILKKLNRK